jgi:Uma2 family endonuclease
MCAFVRVAIRECVADPAQKRSEATMAQQVAAPPVLGGTRRKMSYEEWRAWDYEGPKSEGVAGEAIVCMSTTVLHFRLMDFLLTQLGRFVSFRQLGEVFAETIEMHLGDRGRLPDLMFVRADQLHRVSRTRLDGPADLVIELVSDDSVERDYEEKFEEYAAAGVTEYWIIDARDDAPDPRPPPSTTSSAASTSRSPSTPMAASGRGQSVVSGTGLIG